MDIVLYCVGADAADASEEFSRTPEVSGAKVSSQPGVVLEEHVRAVALQELKGCCHAERGRQLDKAVDVVGHDFKLDDTHRVLMRGAADSCRAHGPHRAEFKRVPVPLGPPDEVKRVLTYRMAFMLQRIHTSQLRAELTLS